MPLLDLPEDILHIVISYLEPVDLLRLSGSARSLQENDDLRFSSSYWSRLTRQTFRVPNHPVVERDGKRWMQLYRRMRTQTKVYTWGNNDLGCLGGELQMTGGVRPMRGRVHMIGGRVRAKLQPPSRDWPTETRMGDVGVIADLQSGGWSNTALNSTGQLFTVGVIDGQEYGQMPSPVPHRLQYPPGFVSPSDRQDPYTAIKQFSSGRAHILGLSDAGRIWSWDDTNRPGIHIKFLSIDTREGQENDATKREGGVRQVVAGWARSSAYVNGTGIVVWEPSNSAELQGESDQSAVDTMLVYSPWVVPGTSFTRNSKTAKLHRVDSPGSEDGEVTNWIVLEKYVLIVKDNGRLYASRIPDSGAESAGMTQLSCLNPSPEDTADEVLDIQGSFRSFAVFKRSGAVLLGDQDYIHARLRTSSVQDSNDMDESTPRPLSWAAPKLRKIPAMQNTGVCAVASGDYHLHALHKDGTISSYGNEPGTCGALGLGESMMYPLRGVEPRPNLRDFQLANPALTTGRRVWFEPEKRQWLEYLKKDIPIWYEVEPLPSPFTSVKEFSDEVSEWFEERLRNWESDAPMRARAESNDTNHNHDFDNVSDDGLPAYFALSVAAAGWHSGALVLVNEEKARKIRDSYRIQDGDLQKTPPDQRGIFDYARSLASSFLGTDRNRIAEKEPEWVWEINGETFPRLKLGSGKVMPGEDTVTELPEHLRQWKDVEMVDL